MKNTVLLTLIIAGFVLFFGTGCKQTEIFAGGSTTTQVAPVQQVSGLTGQTTYLEGYTIPRNGWQLAYAGGYVAHCDDRRGKGQAFKCKIDHIVGNKAGTVAVKRGVQAPVGWTGSGPMPVNFTEIFPDWSFGELTVPSDEGSGRYGEVVAAKAWQ